MLAVDCATDRDWETKYNEATSTFIGLCRKIHQWVNLNNQRYIALGTSKKLYQVLGDSFTDVTPLRTTTSAGDVTFAATNGSSTLTVTDSSHGAAKGDFVTFSGAATLGGLITAAVLNQGVIVTGKRYITSRRSSS